MGNLNFIPLFTARDRERAKPVPVPRSMYGTGSSVFPISQKEMQAETRQAHRHTMEARLRREPEDIRIQARKTAAIRILPALHREAHILPMEMLPETATIRAAVIPLEEAIQMGAELIGEPSAEFYEFYNLGVGELVAVSASHGHGTGDLLDQVFSTLPAGEEEAYSPEYIRVAVIGKPNVGKSSLVNRLAGEERMIVSAGLYGRGSGRRLRDPH